MGLPRFSSEKFGMMTSLSGDSVAHADSSRAVAAPANRRLIALIAVFMSDP